MEFQELIAQLKNDSKKYQFCEEGVDGIGKATSVLQCCAFLRENIVYCFDGEYHEVIADNIDEWYRQWKREFNSCGIWVNESSIGGDRNLVIITQTKNFIYSSTANRFFCSMLIWRNERCFVFGNGELEIYVEDHAKVYSKNPNAFIHLHEYSHGFIKKTVVDVDGFATCYAEDSKVMSNGKCRLFLTASCKWTDYNHKEYKQLEHLGFQ